MKIGYNTNGFAHHRLEDAIQILAELEYEAVAITPDVHHLPPFATSRSELAAIRKRLEDAGLAAVIETGARYVLDPRRKHRPNLLDRDPSGRKTRLAFLIRCAEMAIEIGAGCVSIWSGQRPPETGEEEAREFLLEGVRSLCEVASRLGVRVAFEPEPGMWIESLHQWEWLRDTVRHPSLGLTLDTGHVPCTESITPQDAISLYRKDLINVHLDDVRGRVHEHLQIGDGELQWRSILHALAGLDLVASLELSRHSHDAPGAAALAMQRLKGEG